MCLFMGMLWFIAGYTVCSNIRPPCCTEGIATIQISLITCLLSNNSELFSVILADLLRLQFGKAALEMS